MTFKDWLEQTAASPATVARELGVSRKMIYDYKSGASVPSLKVGLRIEEYTGGKVTLYDWIQGESALSDLL